MPKALIFTSKYYSSHPFSSKYFLAPSCNGAPAFSVLQASSGSKSSNAWNDSTSPSLFSAIDFVIL